MLQAPKEAKPFFKERERDRERERGEGGGEGENLKTIFEDHYPTSFGRGKEIGMSIFGLKRNRV